MLGQYHNNRRNIEVQIMRHFQQNQQLYMPLPCEYGTEFINIIASKKCDTLSLYGAIDMMFLKQNSQISSETLLLEDVASIEPLPQFQDVVLDESDREHLLLMYNKIYPDSCVLQVARLAKTCSKVKNLGVTLLVNSCRTERSACVLAKWCAGNSSFEEPVLDPNADVRPGIIKRFLIVTLKSKACTFQHIIAKVTWLHRHPDRHFFGSPVEVWSLQGTHTDAASAFLPVERIAGRCVLSTSTVQLSHTKEKVSVVIPLCTVVAI